MDRRKERLAETVSEVQLFSRKQWDKLLCCLQVEDSIMESIQRSQVHGNVINDNKGRSRCMGILRWELSLGYQKKAPRGLDI